MIHTPEAVEQYLERIRVSWKGPEDFWTNQYNFALDSGALKEMLTNAFLEGYFEARLNYELPTNNATKNMAPVRL